MKNLFTIVRDILNLQWGLMEELDGALQDPDFSDSKPLGMILRGRDYFQEQL